MLFRSNFNGNEAITRSTAGGAFKFVNVVNLSISGRSNNYKTTENGGFLDVDKVTDLTLNNINYSSNKSNKNGGAISIQEIKNQAIIKNILGKYNEASENGGYLYIGKTANLNVENDEKTISNYTQKVFLTAYGLPIYSKYVEELDLLSESQKQLSYNKMLEYLGPVLKDFSNDASWYEDIIEDLRSEERTFIEIKERVKQLIKNSLRAAAIEQLRSIIHKDVTKNFDSLTNIEQDTLVNKFIKEPLKKLEDTAKNMSNFLAQERNFMTYYALSFIDYKRQDIFGYSYSSSSDFDSFFIQNNKAKNGGFIYVHEVENNALFTELLLRQNTALENGGSVYIHKIGADLAIKESNIENNNAKSGGAFYVGEIVANLFVNNTRTPISDNPYNTPYFDWSNYYQLKARSEEHTSELQSH